MDAAGQGRRGIKADVKTYIGVSEEQLWQASRENEVRTHLRVLDESLSEARRRREAMTQLGV